MTWTLHPARLLAGSLAAAALAAAVALPAGWRQTAIAHADTRAALNNCDVDTSKLGLDAEEQTALDDANAYRAALGLPALQLSESLERAALWKSGDMASRHYGDHDDGFRTWDQRLKDCGVAANFMAENIAGGLPGGGATFDQWKNSPAHDHNLRDGNMGCVGIKRIHAGAGDPYGWYWTMEFSSIDAATGGCD